MLIAEIRRRLTEALKRGDNLEKEILRVALGEIQTAEARGGSVTDEASMAILRKLVKANEETLAHTTDPESRTSLERENAVLGSLLPETLDVETIVGMLAEEHEAIRGASNDGQATGVAMRALKAKGASVSGKDVSDAVKKIRS